MSTQTAVEALQKLENDIVFLPQSSTYNELTQSYFSEVERELGPACFVTPRSASQLAAILQALKPFAKAIKIAICGAGRQATPQVANVRNGITIHLRELKGVELNKEKKIVSVAAGERWGNVYETLAAAGLGIAGDRHSTGGIGGDALQGGLSYFSYAKGFICDQVVNYEVVLASGEIVNANAEKNKDLWIALRGGGNNFGIVTRFDLDVFEHGQMWGGKTFYFQPGFPSQTQSLVDYLNDPNADKDVHICLSLGYAAALGDIMCMNDIFCTRPEKPKALEPFADVQPQIEQMRSLRVDNFKSFTDESFAGAPPNRVVKMSTTVKPNVNLLNRAVEIYHASFQKLKEVPNLLYSITFEPIPVSMIESSVARGGNALGLQPSDGPMVVILLYISFDNAQDEKHVYEVNTTAIRDIENEAQSKGLLCAYRYLNYSFLNQDPLASYGSESRAKLQGVSAKYDAEGFFQAAGAWPFKLSK